ncbi:ATP-binding protein [Tuberibacillus calidus]|uniref:ATP-binding protein n=1 Tax=Tuberibacillus calidus TaxID=340097 RepID=UPI0004127B56|nr:ATP-binding protein [Tuberibacillus calidus]
MEIVRLPNGTEAVVAEYHKQVIPDFAGNPWIEALPDILSPEQVIEALSSYPPMDSLERQLEPHLRIHLIPQRFSQYFQPLEQHLVLYDAISSMIRGGYAERNPLSPCVIRRLSQTEDAGHRGNVYQPHSTAKSMALIGISGSGKTSSLNRILALFPQVIVHSEYQGQDFPRYQVTHIRLEAPYDGSLKALCLQLFSAIDTLLGTQYLERYGNGKWSTNVMIPILSRLLQNMGTGILVVDEIQHLSLARSGGSAQVLNFFTTLINTAQIPVLLVGTPKSLKVLTSEFRQARRSLSGYGSFLWDRLKKDENWALFLSGLWQYQWTRHVEGLTQELSDVMYEETQGIPDVAVKLFTTVQVRAIVTGKERITTSLIRKVANEQLRIIRPMLDALRNGRRTQLLDYEDIVVPDVEEFIQRERIQIDVQTFVQEARKRTESRQEQIVRVKDEAIIRLQLLGISERQASELVKTVLTEQPNASDVNEVVKAAFQLSIQKKQDRQGGKVNPAEDERDLRLIVKKGKEEGMTAYDALKQAGVIRLDKWCAG